MECKDSLNIKAVYMFNPSDCVCDKDGNIIRLKRKQKGFNREVVKIEY